MNKANLILHCGARHVNRDQLTQIEAPARTETWCPTSHIQLVHEVERSLAGTNMMIVNETFGVTEDTNRMFGLLQVANRDETNAAADYAYVIGLRNGMDKTLSAGLAVGSSVFICDNMAFSSEIVFHRKHTKNIMADLPLIVDTAIGQLGQRWNDQSRRIETYKHTAIGNKDAAHMLMEMAGEVFPSQRLTDIYNEFKTPRHVEFGKETVWTLFNSVTEFLKPRAESKATSLWSMPARSGRLHKICDEYSGLVIDTTPAPVEAALANN